MAQAQRKPGHWLANGWDLWAAYRLSLYRTVAQAPWDGKHLPMAVPLSACRPAPAGAARPGGYVHGLADALPPFDPELAFSLLDAPHTLSVLYLALQLRTEQTAAAAAMLSKALEHGHGACQPELWLVATNALGCSPAEQLHRLNEWLSHFGLPPLALREIAAQPPSVSNLRAQPPPQPVAGGPLVPVLMTALHSVVHIGAALDGLSSQSWQNLEVLVADWQPHK